MNRRRILSTLVAAMMFLLVTAVPSHGITGWLKRADVTGRGAADMPSMSGAIVSLPKAHAIRIGVATPKGTSKRVTVDWMMMCDSAQGDQDGTKRVTTKTDGTPTWVTIADGTKNLGAGCMVSGLGSLNGTTQVRTIIQYKSR